MASLGTGEVTLDIVGPEELPECGIGCITNPKHEGYAPKVEWLRKRFAEGLRYLLYRDADGKPLAFLEYVPGAFAWRPVDAVGWLFVHCLWVYPRGQKVGGLGTRLIEACVEEARGAEVIGVATAVSEGPWIFSGSLKPTDSYCWQGGCEKVRHPGSAMSRRIAGPIRAYTSCTVLSARTFRSRSRSSPQLRQSSAWS